MIVEPEHKKYVQDRKKTKKLHDEIIITDVHLFPRCEYYTRFLGTTAFAMDEPKYWGTYHRSESSRFFSVAGSRKNTLFISPCVKKAQGTNSFYAHTGGFHSPFTIREYNKAFTLSEQVQEGDVNIRDRLLLYKIRMVKAVVTNFEAVAKNEQKVRKKYSKTQFYLRPIVYTENDYPCVLIAFPAFNANEAQTEAAKYWQQHPKPFQKLLLCSFIAFLNVEAMQANIPIEMVLRSSFGHNLPSVCETNNTFRINIGIIPKRYAELIGITLHKLNQAINKITDETSPKAEFDANFLNKIKFYNAYKLKKAIMEKSRYKELINNRDFKEAENSDEAFARLYKSFCAINNKKGKKDSATFIPVNLENKTIWEVIRQSGDSMGKSVLCECFREKGTEDWFINQLMDALLNNTPNPIEFALKKLLNCMKYDTQVTLDYEKIHKDLKKTKRTFPNLSFKHFYEDDPAFSEITNILFEGFCTVRPESALYSELERAGTKFFTTFKSSQKVQEEPDYGSDSEFEDQITVEGKEKRTPFAHSKLRVCAGMKAIVLAQYSAINYLSAIGIQAYNQDVEQMYYEVEDALKLIDIKSVVNKVRAEINFNILHFDLNHCNASNSLDNKTLKEKLDALNPFIIILDYTSATSLTVKKSLQLCFSRKNVELVILVDSGLKNNQGGLDINPYGEIRICARNKKTVNTILDIARKGLSEQDKLTPTAHEKVRACKRRGMAFSLFGLFKTNKSRFNAVEEKQIIFSTPTYNFS